MELNKYEKARIIGARALQIAMGAPVLTKIGKELDPIRISKQEYNEDVLPLSISRIQPKRIEKYKKEELLAESDESEALVPEETEESSGEEDKSSED